MLGPWLWPPLHQTDTVSCCELIQAHGLPLWATVACCWLLLLLLFVMMMIMLATMVGLHNDAELHSMMFRAN